MANQVLFDGTVTTSESLSGHSIGDITTESAITADTIIVTFNGTRYECPNISSEGLYEYGAPFNSGSYDFSVFPFNVFADSNARADICTENAGTYTVKIEAAAKTIMHSTLARDQRFNLVFETDDMPTMANGWKAVSGNDAEAYMQKMSKVADHQGTVETDNRFKYFFVNSGDEPDPDEGR